MLNYFVSCPGKSFVGRKYIWKQSKMERFTFCKLLQCKQASGPMNRDTKGEYWQKTLTQPHLGFSVGVDIRHSWKRTFWHLMKLFAIKDMGLYCCNRWKGVALSHCQGRQLCHLSNRQKSTILITGSRWSTCKANLYLTVGSPCSPK